MSATGIVFLALSVVMLGLGFYGASVDVVSATGLAESIGQMKNFYFLLGGLLTSLAMQLHLDGKYHPTWGDPARAAHDEHHHPLRHPHRRGRVHGLSAAVDDQRHV